MTKLDPTDFAIVRELLSDPTQTDDGIAKKIGLSRQTVNKRRNSKSVQEEIKAKMEISSKRVEAVASKAWARLEELLEHPDPRIKLSAASAIIKATSDRFQKQETPEDVHVVLNITKYQPPEIK